MPWLLIAGALIGIANDNYFAVLVSCLGFVPVWFIYISLMKHHAWYEMKATVFREWKLKRVERDARPLYYRGLSRFTLYCRLRFQLDCSLTL